MTRNRIIAGIVGAFALVGSSLIAAPSANAGQALPPAVAGELDRQPIEYSQSAASQRRHMIMRETMRQQRYGNRGHAYGRGYGPRPGYGYSRGYGPRPAYGYRRY